MRFLNESCDTCRLRRIKCDTTKPICQKCIDSKRICASSRTPQASTFTIHLENQFASGEATRPRGPRSALRAIQLQPDVNTRALSYYQQHQLRHAPKSLDVVGGLAECFTAWQALWRQNDIVNLAMSAMALAVYARVHHDTQAATKASWEYNKLLKVSQALIIKADLSKLTPESVDAFLVAIFFMSKYERVAYQPDSSLSEDTINCLKSWSHHDGLLALLALWNDKYSHSSPSQVIKHSRRLVVKSMLLRGRALPEWILDGSGFGEQGLELAFDRVVVSVINLHHTIGNLDSHLSSGPDQMMELITIAEKLDQDLQIWVRRAYRKMSFQKICLPSYSFSSKNFYSDVVFCYQNLGMAANWCYYLALRLLLSSMLMRIMESCSRNRTFQANIQSRYARCSQLQQELMNDICSSVPFCLGKVKISKPDQTEHDKNISLHVDAAVLPYRLGLIVWSMTIASSLKIVNSSQRQWLRSQLSALGKLSGDRVLEGAESGSWLTL